MDIPIARAEHEEFRRTVNAEFERMTAEDNRINKRLTTLENKQQPADSGVDGIGAEAHRQYRAHEAASRR